MRHRRPRVSLALNPGYSEARRLRRPRSAPRDRKGPRPRRPGRRLRYRPARKAGNGEAFCPAATTPDGARTSSPNGRSPDGAAAIRRSTPAKFGEGVQEACGVRRAGRSPDPAGLRPQAGTPPRPPPPLNETKKLKPPLNFLFSRVCRPARRACRGCPLHRARTLSGRLRGRVVTIGIRVVRRPRYPAAGLALAIGGQMTPASEVVSTRLFQTYSDRPTMMALSGTSLMA